MANNRTTYQDAMNFAMEFLNAYGTDPKLAEDPNRPALVPDDMKEGKPQTDEVDKGDGGKSEQGAPGKETAEDVAKMEPDGASVEGDRKNTGDSAEGIIKDPPAVSTSEEPKDDIDKMDNVDPAFKKAYASYLKLSNSVVGMIDDAFNAAAEKNASDDATIDEIVQKAVETKAAHIDFLVKEFGVTPKQANDMLNQLADTDPTAVLPPEAISDEEAEQVLADAAAADTGAEEAAAAEGDVDADIEQFVAEMQAQGFSDEEIMQALEEAADIVDSEDGEQGAVEPAPAEPAPADPAEKAASDPTVPGAAEDGSPAEPAAAPEAADATPAAEGGDMGAVEGELGDIVSQLESEGYSQEEIAQALMEEMDISPDEIVDTVMQDLQSKGFTEEEAGELLQNLGELEAQGVTPEQFAQVLDQLQ